MLVGVAVFGGSVVGVAVRVAVAVVVVVRVGLDGAPVAVACCELVLESAHLGHIGGECAGERGVGVHKEDDPHHNPRVDCAGSRVGWAGMDAEGYPDS